MDAKKHVKERERLSRALNGQETFDGAVTAITDALEKYNLHLTPGIAFDTFVYVLEELHLKSFNPQERRECKTQEIKLTLDCKEIFRSAFGGR